MPSPSTTVCNQMIRGYALSDTPQQSVELYCRMLYEEGLVPDEYTYSNLASACAQSLMFREGEQIHGSVLSNGYYSNSFVRTNLINLYLGLGDEVGLVNAYKVFEEMSDENNPVTWNSLLSGHIRCGDFDGAVRIFDGMPVRNLVSWTTMLSGCARNGWYRHALLLFQEMRRTGLELDQASLTVVLSVCAELGDLSTGKWIHSYVNKAFDGRTRDSCVRLHNALIHMYANCGVIEDACRIFEEMPCRTIVSWTTMIMGYCKHGFAKKALEVFEWMQNSDEVKPDARTLLGVLSACSHGGYVEKGCRYFNEMEEKWAISPSIEHYGCLVGLLSRAGFLEEAQRLIETILMEANDIVWGALLCGCMIHRNPDIVSYAAQKLIMKPDLEKIEYLVPMSNNYATARRWGEVAIWKNMIETSSKNDNSRSWVQINEVIHEFMAGDIHTTSIYEMLNRLSNEIRYDDNHHDTSEELINL
uniref:Uncharacterized protein n=2 Tax=Chenopodium quinoa TaxID=63459 RepID=A0A803L9A8_CHEQI